MRCRCLSEPASAVCYQTGAVTNCRGGRRIAVMERPGASAGFRASLFVCEAPDGRLIRHCPPYTSSVGPCRVGRVTENCTRNTVLSDRVHRPSVRAVSAVSRRTITRSTVLRDRVHRPSVRAVSAVSRRIITRSTVLRGRVHRPSVGPCRVGRVTENYPWSTVLRGRVHRPSVRAVSAVSRRTIHGVQFSVTWCTVRRSVPCRPCHGELYTEYSTHYSVAVYTVRRSVPCRSCHGELYTEYSTPWPCTPSVGPCRVDRVTENYTRSTVLCGRVHRPSVRAVSTVSRRTIHGVQYSVAVYTVRRSVPCRPCGITEVTAASAAGWCERRSVGTRQLLLKPPPPAGP